jgi:hypothetical protein
MKLFQNYNFEKAALIQLKRNIVGKSVVTAAGITSGGPFRLSVSPTLVGTGRTAIGGRTISAGKPGIAAASPACAGITPQKLEIIGDDFHLRPVLTILLPPILPEFTVNPHHFTLEQVLVEGLSLPAPEDDIKKTRLVHPLIPVFTAPIDGNGEFTDRLTVGGIGQFRVPGQSPYKNHVV